LTVKQEEFENTVVEAGLEVAKLALLVVEALLAPEGGASDVWIGTVMGSVGTRVSGLKARVESMVERAPRNERVTRVALLVARLWQPVSRYYGGRGTATEEMFPMEEEREDPDGASEREAKRQELMALFSRKVPETSG
jgi:hypothetical protein